MQYFWHIPFIPLFSINDKETTSWALIEPSRAILLQISSFLGEQECRAGRRRLSRDDSHMPLRRSQGVVCCFFSLPILMNYKIEPKLTVRRTLSGPHTSEMLVREDVFQLFDLIKGSCFSIDFCTLHSSLKQEPGSFPGTIWIPVRSQSLLKDNCLESRSFWILIHSCNDERWDWQSVLFSNLVPTKLILKGLNLPQNVHIWCLMTSEQWDKSIISAGCRRDEMVLSQLLEKDKTPQSFYIFEWELYSRSQAFAVWDTGFTQRLCWISWTRNLHIYLLSQNLLFGRLSPAFPQGCPNKTHCVHTAQPQRRKIL